MVKQTEKKSCKLSNETNLIKTPKEYQFMVNLIYFDNIFMILDPK